MNLQKLYAIQMDLDKRIIEKHGLQGKSTLEEKKLALYVELGELANETRCFKFWSTKEPSAKEVILEEYVDCLHFFLSIGIEKEWLITPQEIESPNSIIKCFNHLFDNLYFVTNSLLSHKTIFEHFISLGKLLGFSWEEVEQAYLEKNLVNHERQVNGY